MLTNIYKRYKGNPYFKFIKVSKHNWAIPAEPYINSAELAELAYQPAVDVAIIFDMKGIVGQFYLSFVLPEDCVDDIDFWLDKCDEQLKQRGVL